MAPAAPRVAADRGAARGYAPPEPATLRFPAQPPRRLRRRTPRAGGAGSARDAGNGRYPGTPAAAAGTPTAASPRIALRAAVRAVVSALRFSPPAGQNDVCAARTGRAAGCWRRPAKPPNLAGAACGCRAHAREPTARHTSSARLRAGAAHERRACRARARISDTHAPARSERHEPARARACAPCYAPRPRGDPARRRTPARLPLRMLARSRRSHPCRHP